MPVLELGAAGADGAAKSLAALIVMVPGGVCPLRSRGTPRARSHVLGSHVFFDGALVPVLPLVPSVPL